MNCFVNSELSGDTLSLLASVSVDHDDGDFAWHDEVSAPFTLTRRNPTPHELRCGIDLEPGEFSLLRSVCCQCFHIVSTNVVDAVPVGTRTYSLPEGADPETYEIPPDEDIYAIGDVQSIAYASCRENQKRAYGWAGDPSTTATPTITIAVQGDDSDPSNLVIAEATVIYGGTGNHFYGSSELRFTVGGTVYDLTVNGSSGGPELFTGQQLEVLGAPSRWDITRETDGFRILFRGADAGASVSGSVQDNTMERVPWESQTNMIGAYLFLTTEESGTIYGLEIFQEGPRCPTGVSVTEEQVLPSEDDEGTIDLTLTLS